MRCGIDAARHAADDHQAADGKVGREAFGHAAAVGRRVTRSHHRNAGLGQYLDVPFHKEDHGRIVNFLQPRRVFRIAE